MILPQFVLQGLAHDGTLCEAFLNVNQQQTSAAFLAFYSKEKKALKSDTWYMIVDDN